MYPNKRIFMSTEKVNKVAKTVNNLREKSLNAAPRERKNSGGSLKSDSYLLGYRVVAQNSVDGFYYPGMLCCVKCYRYLSVFTIQV